MKKLSVLVAIVGILLIGGYFVIQKTEKDKQQRIAHDRLNYPCWFLGNRGSVDRVTIDDYEDREMYGYPTDISIDEALDIFNEEQKCGSHPPSSPALTEDELLSSLARGSDYTLDDESEIRFQENIFREILSSKNLPKGALLINEGAGTRSSPVSESAGDSVRVNGHRIYLFLNLHKNFRGGDLLKNEQVFLVKKVLYGIEGLQNEE